MEKNIRFPIFIVMILFSLFALSACSQTSDVANTQSDWQTIVSENGDFSVVIPKTWSEIKDNSLHDEADLQAAHSKQERYFAALIEHKDDFSFGFEEWMELVQEPFLDEGIELGEATQIEINGRPALQYVANSMVNNINVTYLFTYVDGETYYGQLLCWSLSTKYSAAENEFKQIVESIKGL